MWNVVQSWGYRHLKSSSFWCTGCSGDIEECEDQDGAKMQAKLQLVPIGQLAKFAGKKVRGAVACRVTTAKLHLVPIGKCPSGGWAKCAGKRVRWPAACQVTMAKLQLVPIAQLVRFAG